LIAGLFMLSAEAYSFRHKSRLAISLSWVAGYTNVIMMIAAGEVVSHQTGNSTHFASAIGGIFLHDPAAVQNILYFGFLVSSFLLGAIASAFMTEGARRAGRTSKYILPMGAEAALLSILLLVLAAHPNPSDRWTTLYLTTGLAALAMGLQNATITKISGAVVRTTHVTGVITDLGLESVQLFLWWRDKLATAKSNRYTRVLKITRRHPSALRVLLLSSILGSFMIGAALGTIALFKFGPIALIAPVLFLLWIVTVDYFKPIADVREIDPTRDPDLATMISNLKSMLPPQVGIFRLTHHRTSALHHAPDFSTWAQRIPKHWRIVILVISPLTQFDQDSATSLLTTIQRLRSAGRALVISGMNRRQFKTLMDCALSNAIDLEDFVPDIEFAIARAMNLAGEFSQS
jgi:uncharacterized membrane protein YoaK (UPF0700 family)/anti-anti-sigma regulatory factor